MSLRLTPEDLQQASEKLAAAGIENARREARLLAELAGGGESFAALLARRAAGEPLSRIRGTREFWSLEFQLSSATLDPRPDSETVIEAVLAARPRRDAAYRILDLGTGSGCLLLALLSEYRQASGLGIDLAPLALATASANAARLGFADRATFRQGDWAEGLEERFDILVSNPPYIARAEIAALDPAVRDHDPRLALDGGEDGLEAHRRLAPALPRLLTTEGLAVIEIGADQERSAAALYRQAGLGDQACRRDLAGRPRALIFSAFPPVSGDKKTVGIGRPND